MRCGSGDPAQPASQRDDQTARLANVPVVATITVLATIVVLPVLFLVPGWLWLRRCGVDPLIAVYCGLGVTVAFAAATVGLAILLPWSVRTTCLGAGVLVLLSSAWCLATAPRPLLPPRSELAGIAIFLAAFLAAAAFVAVPSNPPTPMNPAAVSPGRVDTSRWAGMSSDNTLPYRVGQVALYKESGQLRDAFDAGWWITDRTPLVGLDFAFGVGALGIPMRSDNPDLHSDASTQMQVNDPYAYWFYNLVSELLALAVVLGAFLLARVWKRDLRIAITGALVAALSPGFFLNAIYGWPRPAIAYFILVAAALALRGAALPAGTFVALGYLCHPDGAFWAPSIMALLVSAPQFRRRWRRVLGRFLAAAVAVALPWQLFGSLYMHAYSRLLFWPLGAVVTNRTNFGAALHTAWHQFTMRGVAGTLWVRVESTATSLFPFDLGNPGLGIGMPHFTDARIYWATAHGISVWGMLGVILFPALVFYLARQWPRDSRLLIAFIAPYLVVALLAEGFPDSWSLQSAYPLVGLLAILAGEMLLGSRRAVRLFLWLGIAFELLTAAYLGEYMPYHAPTATIILFAILGIGAHLMLIAALGRSLGLIPPSRALLHRVIRPRLAASRLS
jgi:hypothetical protein